jgi:hypothetical protein
MRLRGRRLLLRETVLSDLLLLALIVVRATEPMRRRLQERIGQSKAATFETCDELMFEHESSPWLANVMLTLAAGDHDRCDGYHIGGLL